MKKPRVTRTGLAVFPCKGAGWRWRWIGDDYTVLAESPEGEYYPGKWAAKRAFAAFVDDATAHKDFLLRSNSPC